MTAADSTFRLPPGATGVGSWPGTDPREAAAVMLGELSLPHVVELPARGVGADLIGRASALLVDMDFDTSTRGYRLAQRPGAAAKRAVDLLRQDLDALEEAWELGGYTNRPVKLQAPGPLTLAAEVELRGGHRILTDHGAVRDLSESLAEGLAVHAGEVSRRLGTDVVVQLDEPSLRAVLDGTLRGVSRLDTVRAVPEPDAVAVLGTVVDAQSAPVVMHCCAGSPPLRMFKSTNVAGVGFDLAQLTAADLDGVGELLDAGKQLVLGVIATTPTRTTWREAAETGTRLVDRLGFPRATLSNVLVSPACGLAGAPLAWARQALKLASEVAQAYGEEPESL